MALVPSEQALTGSCEDGRVPRLPNQDEVDAVLDALGIPIGASDTEVKAAYRRAMTEVHPDKLVGASGRKVRLFEAERRRVELAREMHRRYLNALGGASV